VRSLQKAVDHLSFQSELSSTNTTEGLPSECSKTKRSIHTDAMTHNLLLERNNWILNTRRLEYYRISRYRILDNLNRKYPN
jgi:hypothetical protein